MKKIILLLVVLFATPAFADYTLELKNSSGTVIKIYTITTVQVAHIQKAADANGISILTHFESALKNLVSRSTTLNKAIWKRDNDAYIEEQARQ